MSKQIQDAYIVAASRTPIGKAPRGVFRNMRPDDLLVAAVKSALAQVPNLDPKAIEDAIIGCSFPEGEQGMNMARVAMVLAGLPHPHWRGRRDDRRWCREHEHGAHGWQQAELQP
jgi:acetyl-CoA acyltransferase